MGADWHRMPGWETRLAHLEMQARERPFAWGEHDCCTWAADAIRCMTGADPLGGLRGAWRSEDEAMGLLASLGGLHAAVRARLGAPLGCVALARRGDVVMVTAGKGKALAVCMGDVAVAPGPDGLSRVPMAARDGDCRPLLAWRV